MNAQMLNELLKFIGHHQFLTLALALLMGLVIINVVSYSRGKMTLRTIRKRPHEYMGYLAAAATLASFLNHFIAGCQ